MESKVNGWLHKKEKLENAGVSPYGHPKSCGNLSATLKLSTLVLEHDANISSRSGCRRGTPNAMGICK